ncbi:lasso peptide biosynthesis B2 protein [Dyadobacter sp. CY107]|uniref:lasso peptide biosynthesis B2 protein n=1 Tax=Dyadobacter fanqingshengii TaxID=2906443 RepID=UPI001F163408|nr:lasso peptide biosynthesis B2 protein [Dyadobacter fanqingshengii]MCF2502940.1 lasso peptide biosynthesis B2 protein [Dyadobacter fanqingshengii]
MGTFKHHITKWNKLSGERKAIFLKAAVSLVLIKTGLMVLPFGTFRKLFHWLCNSKSTREISQERIDLTVWAIDTAANLLPMELLCLPRALATKYLLRKVPALTLEIGIEVNPAKKFEAHAWVEKNGSVIMGNWPESVLYQRIWVWK